eukprot:PITA_27606
MGWQIHQMDVKTAFLDEVIEAEVYIEQPKGLETHERGTQVCKVKKALYSLKQAPKALYEDEPLILVLYVDDLFSIGSSRLIEECKRKLAAEFDMKDLGLMLYFLGFETNVHTYDYERKIDASDDEDVDPTLYRQLIGFLMYLVNTRPDIYFVVNTLSQFMVEPKRMHWTTAMHILRYVCGTIEYGLRYTRGDGIKLCGFTDAD